MNFKYVIRVLSIYFLLVLAVSETKKDTNYPFQNISLPWDERLDDLVSRLTIEEIIIQLGSAKYEGRAPAIPRLNILPYNFLHECLRGVVKFNF